MASSKLMLSTSPTNPDLPRDSSIQSLSVAADLFQGDQGKSFGSMNMDELFKNIYGDSELLPTVRTDDGGGSVMEADDVGGISMQKSAGGKTVDDVWREIVAGSGGGGRSEREMTLEDFLTKAGAVREEEVRIPEMPQPLQGFRADSMLNGAQFQAAPSHLQPMQTGTGSIEIDSAGFGNGSNGRMIAVAAGGSGGAVGRGKRRAVEEPPMDKATQQKQRRMIKNRESAARSRERKQVFVLTFNHLLYRI